MASSGRSPRGGPLPLPSSLAAGEPRSRYRSLADPESLREFARNLGEGIYITTPDGRILDANPEILCGADLSAPELVGTVILIPASEEREAGR